MVLGVMLFFDAVLLALGNLRSHPTFDFVFNTNICVTLQLLFLSGLTLIIGPQKTFYFSRKQKLRGTLCFLGGILLVFLKYPFIGMVVETFGFLNLFGYLPFPLSCLAYLTRSLYSDFFPVLTFSRQLPFVGTLLSLPYIRPVRNWNEPIT